MIIKKMRANFGCLEGAEMELRDGLNIIEAPNESGKSTWCAFIRCMLYGIDSSRREKAGVKPDKTRFAPWNGSAMAGEMEIEHEGKSISLSRSGKASAPFRDFSAVYSGTASPVAGLDGKNAGEALTGLPASVFESSVFIRQAGLSVSSGPELEKRINAIVSTGDEDSRSWSDADSELRKWLRLRRFNRSGAIPALDTEIERLEEKAGATRQLTLRREGLEKELEDCSRRCEALAERSARERAMEAEARLSSLNSAREALRSAQENRDKAASHAEATAAAVKSSLFGRSMDTVEREMQSELQELERRSSRLVPRWICLLVMALGLVLCFGSNYISMPKLMFIPGIVILAGATVPAALYRTRLKAFEGWCAMLEAKYGSDDAETLAAALATWKAQAAEAELSGEELALAEEKLRRCEAELSAAESRIVSESFTSPARRELEECRARRESIARSLAALEGQSLATGDPMVLASELDSLRSRRDELQQQYDALSLAISTLAEANTELEQRFSPRLGHRAGEYLSRLTAGRYDSLSFDRSLAAKARVNGDILEHESAYLSAGAVDQVYLALRLAICELALPEGCSCPLILDDALVNFDDERMALALELLEEIARERQVILFSCHSRESDYINSRKGE